MDLKKLASQVISLAKSVGMIVPGVSQGAAIAEKVVDIIDDLTDGVDDPRTQEELTQARNELRAAVHGKAQSTADRLEGKE